MKEPSSEEVKLFQEETLTENIQKGVNSCLALGILSNKWVWEAEAKEMWLQVLCFLWEAWKPQAYCDERFLQIRNWRGLHLWPRILPRWDEKWKNIFQVFTVILKEKVRNLLIIVEEYVPVIFSMCREKETLVMEEQGTG